MGSSWTGHGMVLLLALAASPGIAGDAPKGTLGILAGSPTAPESLDGPLAAARFGAPEGLVVDPAGDIYLTDYNFSVVRRISAAGMVTTLAGSPWRYGFQDGPGAEARFYHPEGLALDAAGNLYVADGVNGAIRRIAPSGAVTTVFKNKGPVKEGAFIDGLALPTGLALDTSGTLFATDPVKHVVWKIGRDAAPVVLAGSDGEPGVEDGSGGSARFARPGSLCIDRSGNLYVIDREGSALRKVTPQGEVTTLYQTSREEASAEAETSPRYLSGVAIDPKGTLYLSAGYALWKLSPGGQPVLLAGRPGEQGTADGAADAARFSDPAGLALDAAGCLYVAERFAGVVRKVTPDGKVATVAGKARLWTLPDSKADDAPFRALENLAVDGSGRILAADSLHHVVRRISPDGRANVFAGRPKEAGREDRAGALAGLCTPTGMTADARGNLYVTETETHVVRRISPEGQVLTIAGMSERPGSEDGQGANAHFKEPHGLSLDAAGNVYVADTQNHAIRRISPQGLVTTLAGKAEDPGSKDGPKGAARFFAPRGVLADRLGNIFVADTGNHVIRRISPSGAVSTFAGSPGVPGLVDGRGPQARFFAPATMILDRNGNLLVAELGNCTIRSISPSGEVRTILGVPGQIGTRMGPLPAPIGRPNGLALDQAGDLHVTVPGAILKVSH